MTDILWLLCEIVQQLRRWIALLVYLLSMIQLHYNEIGVKLIGWIRNVSEKSSSITKNVAEENKINEIMFEFYPISFVLTVFFCRLWGAGSLKIMRYFL